MSLLSGLDCDDRSGFEDLIKGLRQQGKAVFYCSHVLEVVEQVCFYLLIFAKRRRARL